MDFRAGKLISSRPHNQECRLRTYLSYKESDHPKWLAVRHLLEDHDTEPKFKSAHVDKEGAPAAPTPLFEAEPLPDIEDEEMKQAAEAVEVNLRAEPMAQGCRPLRRLR